MIVMKRYIEILIYIALVMNIIDIIFPGAVDRFNSEWGYVGGTTWLGWGNIIMLVICGVLFGILWCFVKKEEK